MPSIEITALLLLAMLAWLWFTSLRAREIAVQAARRACTAEALMLLDDTVAISSVKLARGHDGRVKLQRAYAFEYSDTGNNRLKGSIVLLGLQVTLLNLAPRAAVHLHIVH